MSKYNLEEITYELFEINPNDFYKDRFVNGYIDPAIESKIKGDPLTFQKSNLIIEAVKEAGFGDQYGRILDIGCGGGVFGKRLKYHFPKLQIYGVDLSDSCVEQAKANGYLYAISCDIAKGLPFDDDFFDFVFTTDFFGHIEFCNKDKIISEISRVTKKGGFGFHGIETGIIDYCNCNPKDPDDIIRKYVYIDGHIGVESLENNVVRFEPYFTMTSVFPWLIKPILTMDIILKMNYWTSDFSSAFQEIDSHNCRKCSDIILGYLNTYYLKHFRQIFGDILIPDRLKLFHDNPVINQLVDTFLGNVSFSILKMQKVS